MRRISIENPSVDRTYRTYVDSDYSSGTILTVKNNASFAANDLIVVGEPTEELTELKQVSSVSGTTTINISSALSFSHPKTTPVYKVVWNFVSLERRTSSSGTFAEITQSGIQWDSKTNETIYFDRDATNAYQYRFRFYNSVTATYSEYSATISGAVPGRTTVQYMIDQVRKLVGDPERKIVSDDEIIRFFNRAQDIVYAKNPKWWFLLVDTYRGGSGIAATASTGVYTLVGYSTFGHLASVRYKYTSGSINMLYHLRELADTEFDIRVRDLNKTTDDNVLFYKLLPADSSSSAGYFQVDPTPKNSSVGTFYPNYYEKMADLATVADTTQVPYPAIIEDYAIAQVYKIKGNEQKAGFYEAQFFGSGKRDSTKLTGVELLIELDNQQKRAQDQPVSISRFRGQKYMSQTFGEQTLMSPDYYRENYF